MKTRLSDVVLRTSVKCQPEISSETRWVGADHVDESDFKVRRWSTTDDPLFPPTFKFRVPAGSVLLHSRNPKKVVTLDFDAITGEKFFCLVSADPQLLDSRFLALQLQSSHFAEYVSRWMSGSVNKFLNWSALANYEFELPSLEEQTALVDLLTEVDLHIEHLKKLRTAIGDLHQVVVADRLSNSNYLEATLNLHEVADLGRERIDPRQENPSRTFFHWSIPAFDSSGTFSRDAASSIESHKFCVRSRSLLVSLLNPRIPRIVVVDGGPDVICSTEFAVLTPRQNITAEFLECVASTRHFQQKIQDSAVGTTGSRERTSPAALMSVEIPVLKSHEQMRLVNDVGSLTNAARSSETALAEAKNLRAAVLNSELS